MNISLMQRIMSLNAQAVVDALIVKFRFGNVDPASLKVIAQLGRDVSANEAHSYLYFLKHEDFNASLKEARAKLKDLRAH